MKHSGFESGGSADGQLNNEALGFRDRLYHLLKSLDQLVEPPEQKNAPPTVDRVRRILKGRRLRDRFFEAQLFADPAWDILLELYAAELGGYRVSVSSLCIGAAVPITTALRWIKSLEQKGLLVRHADPSDGRRIYVSLSTGAAQKMDRLLDAIPASEPLI